MRILVFNNEFPPLGGGTAIKNYNLFKVWETIPGLEVDLVTSSRTRNDYERKSFSENITLHKVPVDNRNIHHAANVELLRYTCRAYAYAQRELDLESYDIAIAFHGVPAGAVAWRLSRKGGFPFIVILEGADIPGFETRYKSIYPLLKPLLRRIWTAAARVTAISKEHLALAHAFMPEMEIPMINNGVDAKAFHPPEQARDTAEIHFTCVGRLIERKGQHFLIEAFSRLVPPEGKQLKLSLVGTGDAEPHLRELAKQFDVVDRVDFRGTVALEDMPAAYREANIFVLPSMSEGMSLGLLEAMASGLPVIVTDAGGTAELVKGNGSIIQWADIDGLQVAMQDMLADEAGRVEMARRSRSIAEQFSWEAVSRTYLDLCREIIESK
jgi:phosphatidylinositol alpha-1,6-mannosyltransferase